MGAPFFITGCDLKNLELCGGAPPTTIIGTEIEPQKSFAISFCQIPGDLPTATGAITLSTAAQGGDTIGVLQFTTDPNTLGVKNVPQFWSFNTPDVPPFGPMSATVTVKREVLE